MRAATGLRAESVDAAMCVDALQLMPHRNLVIAEIARILKAGGRFAFTTWLSREADSGLPFPTDYRPLLESAGLGMDQCHEPPTGSGGNQRCLRAFGRVPKRFVQKFGDSVAAMLTAEAVKMSEAYPLIRRVDIAAKEGRLNMPLQPTSGPDRVTLIRERVHAARG